MSWFEDRYSANRNPHSSILIWIWIFEITIIWSISDRPSCWGGIIRISRRSVIGGFVTWSHVFWCLTHAWCTSMVVMVMSMSRPLSISWSVAWWAISMIRLWYRRPAWFHYDQNQCLKIAILIIRYLMLLVIINNISSRYIIEIYLDIAIILFFITTTNRYLIMRFFIFRH